MQPKRKNLHAVTLLCLLQFAACSAPSAIVTFSDLASFLSATGPVALESFENSAPLVYEAHPPTDFGPFTVTVDGRFSVFTTGPTTGQHPTDGTHYFAFQARTLQLTFEEPITALAMDFVDFGDLPLFLGEELTMSTSAGDFILIKKTIEDRITPSGNEFFFGFTSDLALAEVTFHLSRGETETVAVDAVRYVPEPSFLHLWTCVGLCLFGRRRAFTVCYSPRVRHAPSAPVQGSNKAG